MSEPLVSTERQVILGMLEPLFERAKREGLWFYHCGLAGTFWFSPEELRTEHRRGKFIWGPVNWTLARPSERLTQLRQELVNKVAEVDTFVARVEKAKGQ